MKRLLLILAVLLLSASFALARPVYAQNGDGGGKVVYGDDFTLKKGETNNGDLVVLGGNVTIEEGATVTGNVVVLGGNVDVAGHVQHDMTIMGGNASLLKSAVIDGQLSTIGGTISREEGAQVLGGESQGFGPGRLPIPFVTAARPTALDTLLDLVWAGILAVFFSVVASVLAALVMILLPDHTTRVSAAVLTAPLPSGLLGFLSLLAIPIVLVLVALTICLSPLTLVGGVLYGAAIIFGWLALGLALGQQTAKAFKNYTMSPAILAAGGTFVLTLLLNLMSVGSRVGDVLSRYGGGFVAFAFSCLGFLLPLTLASLGLGAVILTRFGTQPYLVVPAAPPAPPASPITDVGEAPVAS